jgi:hypothetical protein
MDVIRYEYDLFHSQHAFDRSSQKYINYVKVITQIKNNFGCFNIVQNETLETNHHKHHHHNIHHNVKKDHRMNWSTNPKHHRTALNSTRKPPAFIKSRSENDTDQNPLHVIRSQLNKLSNENFSKICLFINFQVTNVIEDVVDLIVTFCSLSNSYSHLYSGVLLYLYEFINSSQKVVIKTKIRSFLHSKLFVDKSVEFSQNEMKSVENYDDFCSKLKSKQECTNIVHMLFYLSQYNNLELHELHQQILIHLIREALTFSVHEKWTVAELNIDLCIVWCKLNSEPHQIPLSQPNTNTFIHVSCVNLIDSKMIPFYCEELSKIDTSKNLKLKFKILDLKELFDKLLSYLR